MDKVERRLLFSWSVLIVMTLLSYDAGVKYAFSLGALATLAVVGLAFCKVLIVFYQYMDAREAPWQLRAALIFWCLVVGLAISGLWTD